MDRRTFLAAAATLAAGAGLPRTGLAQTGQSAALTPPTKTGGMTLEEALWARQSRREYSDKPLPEDILSGLLFAAFGINRPESGKRTAPSSHNRQEIDIYLAAKDGSFLYDPKAHGLVRLGDEDLRALTGRQAYVATAAVNLVYVADMSRGEGEDADKLFAAAADTGFIAQNAYLYCAAMGLATVVRSSIDRPALAKALHLGPEQRITLAQCVGYPKA